MCKVKMSSWVWRVVWLLQRLERGEEMGREGNRQAAVVCPCLLCRCSGTVEQIVASEMAVKSRKNVPEGNAELRNAPHLPYTTYTSRKLKRNKITSS